MTERTDDDRTVALRELVSELRDEQDALALLLAALDGPDWLEATPAPGWDVRDQVAHLSWFERAAWRTVADPAGFADEAARASADFAAYQVGAEAHGRSLPPSAVLGEWTHHATRFRAVAVEAGPRHRVGWFVTEMSVTSLASARLMEAWAHGQDVRDAVGAPPEVSDRLRHVAHLGANAMGYAFVAHGLEPPAAPVRVELELPSGAMFTFGPEAAADRVTGPVLDFCLLVTQRRHADDLDLSVEGPTAEAWMPVAQAFAGPPGEGRRPGFATR